MPGRRLRYPSCIKPGISVLSNTEQTMPGSRTYLRRITRQAVYRCERFPVLPPYNE
ncbi:hypothetical protein DPMN_132805 [Dreissena polymorpha]|uniref:Uncharacterized protein n=1 Tax=Dreissena polymorpha TaxID=45954 RepID=A0A9D4FT50_DREPO|nr:hypothetical protein DPMN_132805 [Dreissena polymorpha]